MKLAFPLLKFVVVASAALLLPTEQILAAYPDKTVRIIASFPPGGATDAVARIVGAGLSDLWKQNVVVENKTGAGGNIGANLVAKSAPDGYTLLMGSPAETVINPLLYPEMQYDAEKDLAPITKVGSAPLVLVAHPSVGANTVPELIDYLKKHPNEMSYASSGTGGPQHLAGEEFKRLTGTSILHVPYKGGSPAITDLAGGQVQIFFAGLPPALPFIASGKIKPLAVTTKQRTELAPDIPSIAETSLPEFDIENWQGLFAPGGTPSDVIEKIAHDVATVLADAGVKKRLASQGVSATPTSTNQFVEFTKSEREKFSRIIKEAKISIK